VEQLDADKLAAVLESESRGVLIDFWSPWCGPCRALKPHLAKLADEREKTWRFVAVNTEAHPEVAEDYGVTALPTLVFLRAGEELSRLAGAALPSTIDAKLDELA